MARKQYEGASLRTVTESCDGHLNLASAIIETAVEDYKTVTKWILHGNPYKQKASTLGQLDRYFALREFFDNGCDGMVAGGKVSLAEQLDKRLMAEGIDSHKARYKANKMLLAIGKDFVSEWDRQMRKNRRMEVELND